MTTIAERIRQLRGNQSRNRFAATFGKSPRTIERWEKGQTEPSEADLRLLMHEMGLRYQWLRSGEGSMQEEPVPATGQVTEDFSPVDQLSSEDLEESARSVYLQLIGPGGRVMMQVDLVIMTTTKPHRIALDVKEGIG